MALQVVDIKRILEGKDYGRKAKGQSVLEHPSDQRATRAMGEISGRKPAERISCSTRVNEETNSRQGSRCRTEKEEEEKAQSEPTKSGVNSPHGLFYKEFGLMVRKARTDRGMLQRELAELVGVSRITIANIENARFATEFYIALKLINTLGLE